MAGSANVLVALGLVFMAVGGVGLIFGQLMLENQDRSTEGSFVTVDLSAGSEDVEGPSPQQLRTFRFMGLVVGVWGVVVAITGGLIGSTGTVDRRRPDRR